jgi:surfactin synthase thioesterase subunit
MNRRLKKILIRTGIGIVGTLLLAAVAFYIYTLDYYRADMVARNTSITKTYENYYVFSPDPENDLNTGFVFYPGGKVEALAYAPLMKKLSDSGVTAVLVEMPFNLAVFDTAAANRVRAELKNLDNWFIGGHSLGGAMASSYLEKTDYEYMGLILLGAYPLGDVDIPILALVGSEDGIINQDRLDDLENPTIIQGGNHGNFGNYGFQKGDGNGSLSRIEQQNITVEEILKFIQSNL